MEVTQQHQLTAQANKTGYICITIDLTQNNTSTGTPGTSGYSPVNNQLRLELVDVLNQQGLNSGGLIHTFPLYSYTSTGTSVALTKFDKSFFKKWKQQQLIWVRYVSCAYQKMALYLLTELLRLQVVQDQLADLIWA